MARVRTRLKDVAASAGVSVKTVSNVVNGYAHVSPAMRAKVDRALSELHYQPNLSARGLRNGRSGIIALALPELDAAYFAEIAQQVIRAADERGWTVLVDATEGDRQKERAVAGGIRPNLIDGLIFNPMTLNATELRRHAGDIPLVLLGERLHRGAGDHVAIDNVAAAQDAVEHLLQSGRRRIAAIGAQHATAATTARRRLRGYRLALDKAGIAYEPGLVMDVQRWHRSDGATAALALAALPNPPDAIFCFNDLLALGALRALCQAGVHVPREMAIVGFDDIEEGRYSTPSLTTIAPDKPQIAHAAVDLLARRLDPDGQAPGPPVWVRARYQLIPRESSATRRHPSAMTPSRSRARRITA